MEETNVNQSGNSNIRSAGLVTTKDSGAKNDYQNVENGGANHVADWRQLFAVSADQTLKFYPPRTKNGKVIVSPPQVVIDEGASQWENSLVAQFIGRVSNFSLFQRLANSL